MSTVQRIADVISLPARTVGSQTASLASNAAGQVRVWTANEVDDWGRDNGFVDRFWAASRLRWRISVGGAEHVPKRAGALVVVNARRFALAPLFASLAIGAAVDRPVRFVGRPDIAPVGPLMQRLGALLPIVGEIEGALRAGEIVVLGTDHQWTNEHAGTVDHRLVGAAVATKVRVLPAATMSLPTHRGARVEIGPPVRPTRKRRGPLEELELADHLQVRVNALLDELGGARTGTFLDWLPFSGLGGL
jgi:1-acyl-sn-glycerol-3-phosphate acyltransferase